MARVACTSISTKIGFKRRKHAARIRAILEYHLVHRPAGVNAARYSGAGVQDSSQSTPRH